MCKEIQNIINDYNGLRKQDNYSSNEDLMMNVLQNKGVLPYKDINNTDHDFMLKANIISAQFYLMLLSKPFEDVINFYGNWDNKEVIERKAENYLAKEKRVKVLAI